MAERNKMSLLLMVLQITAVTAHPNLFFTVRDGDEVTLPCESVISDECNSTTWLLGSTEVVALFEHGRIHSKAGAKADRLSVAASCSLVIKKVSAEDAGSYTCRQFRSGQQGPESQVYLSVTTMTEHKGTGEVTLRCSVQTFGQCHHTVKWLYVDKGNKDVKASQSTCSADVTFDTSLFRHISKNNELLKCNVTDANNGKVHLFAFTPPSSGQDTGEDAIVPPMIAAGKSWWWYVLVASGVAALLITAVVVVRWRRNKANRTQDDNIGLTSNPAVTQSPPPETGHDSVDPDDGVSYTYISHTKKTNSKGRIRGGDEAVTYSTVKAPPSSAGASADPSTLYATIS